RHVGCAELGRQGASINGRQVVDDAGLQFRAQVGGGGELALGQAVAAVVLNDVNHGEVAAHEVHELPDTDRGGVAVAAHADGDQGVVGVHRPGGDRRHASVNGVEAVGAAQEVRRALRRTPDAGKLGHAPGLDTHFVER